MDVITMALTKPKEINLADYGIDIVSIVMGGVKETVIEDVGTLWADLNGNSDIVVHLGLGTVTYKMTVTERGYDNQGDLFVIAMNLYIVDMGVMTDVKLQLSHLEGNTYVYCVTANTPIA